jgi:hypothetical protein
MIKKVFGAMILGSAVCFAPMAASAHNIGRPHHHPHHYYHGHRHSPLSWPSSLSHSLSLAAPSQDGFSGGVQRRVF